MAAAQLQNGRLLFVAAINYKHNYNYAALPELRIQRHRRPIGLGPNFPDCKGKAGYGGHLLVNDYVVTIILLHYIIFFIQLF